MHKVFKGRRLFIFEDCIGSLDFESGNHSTQGSHKEPIEDRGDTLSQSAGNPIEKKSNRKQAAIKKGNLTLFYGRQ